MILIKLVIKTLLLYFLFQQPCIRSLFLLKINLFIGGMVLTLMMTSLLPKLYIRRVNEKMF